MKVANIKKNATRYRLTYLPRNTSAFRGLMFLLVIIIISFGSFVAGIKLDKRSYGDQLKAAIELNWRIPINMYKGLYIGDLEEIDLGIEYKNLQKLYFVNDSAVQNNYGLLDTESSAYVPIVINYNNNEYNAKTRVKGNWLDSRSNNKLSLRVKLPNNKTIMGMKRFSIHDPKVKSYISEWLFYELLKHEGLITLRYDFIKVSVNGDKKGIFAIEEHFDKRLIENNKKREGLILKLDETNQVASFLHQSENQKRKLIMDYQRDSYSLSPFNTYSKILEDKKLFEQFKLATSMFEAFRSNTLSTKDIFDIDQFAKLVAITDLLGDRHSLKAKNIKFYFNPITSLIEPIGYDQHLPIKHLNKLYGEHRKVLGSADKLDWADQLFNDLDFYRLYIKYLYKYSEEGYLEKFYQQIKAEYSKKLNITYSVNPLYIDKNFKMLAENQIYIRNKLSPSELTHAYLENHADKMIKIKVGNVYSSPIEVVGILFKGKKYQVFGENFHDSKGESGQISFRTYKFQVDDTVDNLELNSLKVISKIVGGSSEIENKVYLWPMHSIDTLDNTILAQELDLESIIFLNIDKDKIYFEQDKIVISEDLIIPPEFSVYINEGTIIDLINGASIISYSAISATGSDELPITITSSDGSGGGLVLLNASKRSSFKYIDFNNLSNPAKDGWELTGAITSYQSDIEVDNCSFKNNISGDDFLNIIRSNFMITNSIFNNIKADAFDSDFSVGSIKNSRFANIGNDGIDTSGSDVMIENLDMKNIGDKGISVGEKSVANVKRVKIDNAYIGVASKDSSMIEIIDLEIINTNIGLTAFQKKTEYGPSSIEGKNIKMDTVLESYLIEESSYCKIDNQFIKPSKFNVKN